MRLAIDARELTGQPTGVGRVLSGLLEAWPEDDELLLYARSPLPWRFLGGRRRSRIVPGPDRLPGVLWEQLLLPRLLRQDRAEALFAPAYGMPVSAPCPVVVGMHDCACEATPQEFGWRERRRRQWVARRACERAAYLFTGSQFAAGEIERWYGVPESRIVVAPYGLGSSFRAIEPERIAVVRQRYALDGRTVLFAGAALARRDLSAAVEAVVELRASRPDIDLCCVGPPAAAMAIRGDRCRHLGFVPDEDLAALYAAATVVVYPSSYEGFGFPVLEALACGTPVIASDAGSLPEIFAAHARLIADDVAAWRDALATLLDHPDERRHLVEKAQPWALRRGWGPAARLLRRLLTAASGRQAEAA